MALHAIAYVSSACWELTDSELRHVVDEARRLNALSHVTGVLLHCDGNFMQYFEGRVDAVHETFKRIEASRQHHQINVLLDQPIVEREFAQWTMGFSHAGAQELLELAHAPWNDLRQIGPGAELLRGFWRNCRFHVS